MCSEGLCPASREAIVEDGGHHGLLQFGIVGENERSLRISEVNGIDTAIGVVFLREPEQVAVLVLEELVGSHHMAIGAAENLGILLAAGFHAVVVNHLVELAAALHDTSVAALHGLESVKDGDAATVCPIALVSVVEILNIFYFIVTHHHEAGCGFDRAEVTREGEGWHVGCLAGRDATEAKASTAALTALEATASLLTLWKNSATLDESILNL